MHSDHIDALWRHFTSARAEALVDQFRAGPRDEVTAVLDVSEFGPSSPASPLKYFTVKLVAHGRAYFKHLEAEDNMQAGSKALARNLSATSAKVVRELSREEFERLTKRPS